MMSECVRRITVLLLTLALTAGLMSHGFRAAEMGVKMAVAAASDMQISGRCDGCSDGHDGMQAGTCSPYCGTVSALPSVPAVYDVLPIDAAQHLPVLIGTGWGGPPDPYPPRLIGLS